MFCHIFRLSKGRFKRELYEPVCQYDDRFTTRSRPHFVNVDIDDYQLFQDGSVSVERLEYYENNKCGVVHKNGTWSLKSTYPYYYYQVQMQLGIMGLSHCDFIAHTKRGNHIIEVPYDDIKVQEIVLNLDSFAKYQLFPHLV